MGQGHDFQRPSYLQEPEIKKELAAVRSEVAELDEQLKRIQQLRALRVKDEDALLERLRLLKQARRVGTSGANGSTKSRAEIDYNADWEWSQEMQTKMKNVFGINSFRLCQKSVCNANMDGADIVCVMPTGGGKSLTYQLPALLTSGLALVISPLISLITDQILHLREAGVEAVMLTGSTPKTELQDIYFRLTAQSSGKISSEKTIKLPERIASSKTFMNILTKLANAEQLARIVIDEAHCVSQLGHDFRPDYKKLNILRQLFPTVPIMALSATCPPRVLQDLVTILRLPPVVDGSRPKLKHTLYFSAPLYRKNLHYCVLPKPSSSEAVIKVMVRYILENHKDQSGIVYCLSKNDAAKVAEGLHEKSEGKIRTGVYHADVKDKDKQDLHRQWRKGIIKVVCATIAFGLGIDKGDVRFVLHHAPSKSLDGFYQESGRAGRDGQDADCVLYYRPQDAVRLSALICGEVDGQEKLHGMLSFATELEQCRKVHFAKYFSTSSHLSIASWSTDETDALANCGHCDNCTRPPGALERKDVTAQAWQILKVAEAVQREKGQLTLGMLADLARGTGGGTFDVRSGGRNAKERNALDLDAVAHGKVDLSKEDAEALVTKLILLRYLVEEFSQNAYTTNVYFTPGPSALRITRHAWEDLHLAPKIEMCFRGRSRPNMAKKARPSAEMNRAAESQPTIPSKRKRVESTSEHDSDCMILGTKEILTISGHSSSLPSEGQDDDDWQNVTQVQRSKGSSSRGGVRYGNANRNDNNDMEIVILSSD